MALRDWQVVNDGGDRRLYLESGIIGSPLVGSFKIPDIILLRAKRFCIPEPRPFSFVCERFLVHAPYRTRITIRFETPKCYLARYALLVDDSLARKDIRVRSKSGGSLGCNGGLEEMPLRSDWLCL